MRLPIIDLAAWKAQASAGQAPGDAVLRKQFVVAVDKAADEASRRVTFTISTASVDRDNDTLAIAGWDFTSYLRNPVVLWAHGYRTLPVARAAELVLTGDAVRAVTEFATPGRDYEPERWPSVQPDPETCLRYVRGGFLNAVSVGFRPRKYAYNEERRGYDFLEQELLEFSIVPVPANPEALVTGKSAAADVAQIKAWAEQALEQLVGAGMWLPRAVAEAAFKAAPTADEPPAPAPEKALPAPPAPPVMTLESMEAATRAATRDVVSAAMRQALGRLD